MARRSMGLSPNRPQHCPPIVRQSPLDNLSFDEVQSQLGNTGKPIHGMNLDDELHKSVISAEGGHLVQGPSSDPHSFLIIKNTKAADTKTNSETWRGSLMNRSDTLLKLKPPDNDVINIPHHHHHNVKVNTDSVMPSHLQNWLQIPSIPSINIHLPHYESHIIENTSQSSYNSQLSYSENSISTSSSYSDSKSVIDSLNKKKNSDERRQKDDSERKQKRMAKNRESAARSRAKKQEHVNKLENEKCCLQKVNSNLKKLKELEEKLFSSRTLTPRSQLRRSNSTSF